MSRLCRCRIAFTCCPCMLIAFVFGGCSSESSEPQVATRVDPVAPRDSAAADSGPAAEPAADDNSATPTPFVLGDLLEPFEPPTAEELAARSDWVDQPVLDSMQLMREYQQTWGPPPLTVEQALALRNNSPEDNEKLLRTLGRLAPSDGSGANYAAKWVRQTPQDLKSTNPLMVSSVTEFDYLSYTSFGLFSFDWQFNPFASQDSVVSWQSSEDRMLDKVVLRDDLTWSDGMPITAHDVEFSFKVIMSDAVIVPAMRTGTQELRGVKAYDDHTVVFFHKESLATNPWNVNFSIIPKHIYERTIPVDPTMARSDEHSRLEDAPVVGGPYTLEKRVRGQEFVLKRRESYYMHEGKQVRDKPYFAEVRFKIIEDPNTGLLALKAGEVEEQEIRAEQWQSQTNGDDFYERNTKVTGLEWTSFHIGWNLATPYFSDQRVRQAMSYALDYDEMLNTIFYGLYQPNQGTFHPTSWMFPENGPAPYKQDLDKAEDLLDEAGWSDSDGDGYRDKQINGRLEPFRFTLTSPNSPAAIKVSTLMKESLDAIGIVCTVKPTESTVLQQMCIDRKFQAYLGGWGTGADPDTTANLWKSGEARNFVNYSNARVDELFEKAKRAFDRQERARLYGEIHMQLWEDQPYTWLYYRNSFYGFSKKLRGYNFSPRGPYTYGPGASSIFMPAALP